MKTFLLPTQPKSLSEKILTIIFILASLSGFSVLKTAIGSGNYCIASTWSPAGKPECGDKVMIPSGITVTVSTTEDYYGAGCTSAMQYTVAGKLYFTQTNRLSLPCGSEVWVMPGGLVDGEANNNSQRVFICDVEVWSGRDPGAGYLYWYIGLLPLDLVNFDAVPAGKKNTVKWETAAEIENDYFEIEKSNDGVNFYPIKQVDSKATDGNSNSPLNYSIDDENVSEGTSYYRLKQIDINKKVFFSRIASIDRDSDGDIKFVIFPNPNNGHFSIDLKGVDKNADVEIKIYDCLGKKVREYFTDAFAIQSQDFNKELGELDKTGVYVVTFNMDDKTYCQKLIKQ